MPDWVEPLLHWAADVENVIVGALAIWGFVSALIQGKDRYEKRCHKERRRGGVDFDEWRKSFAAENHADHAKLGERIGNLEEKMDDKIGEVIITLAELRAELRGRGVINGNGKGAKL